ncbi:MAG: tripartite tricarboxylate transporter substrate binding protein [Burkholderiaceae bacterium]|jgi:tripartite-type tricarboxylate transporter receptor subunit TctC|uniref:Tripartite tricarboxylate transporter substrate binding protein n=1 Tax=Cupriavidus metallidurans TaxID=119219 RepID=A0A482IWY7_9BURK|nr:MULTISPECIES: tripartite tricarboxylate transporter substrate binding protein [Cupriavidus]PCH56048.1 MAG: tripartite tricarboxylate transporter substrate binding protein [Burkholderiaceae bacterium]EKZ99864.1 ABC transporter substrate-binding protein [Cupriavidus sp. HMR-1]KWR75886.1 ABC transporter substrate-binding protein [Cupriavidus sp. SHE]QBP11987.1 tripartite tricarboxylate transporter substrate binding protein [Cupriavidus metallidurans]QWC91953.1 tripartite tricarboxylate transpo
MYVRMFTRRHVVAMLAAAASLAAIPAAQANDAYPAKPIRMVVGFPSGGAPDILARIFSEKFSLGQPVIVDNKPGAGGNIGAETVARSAPDGYTLALGTVGTHSINGALYSKMPYDMVKDFTPVILLASTPNVLVVHPSVPAKNVQELIALAKAKPGQLTFGTPGIGTSLHVAGELFNTMAGTKIEHVPYKGRAMAIPDLLGGHITMMFDNLPSALPVVKEGKLRALGVTSAHRSASAPDIPTIAEQGLPGYEATSWFAVFVPAHTPKEIVVKLNAEMNRIFTQPDVQAKLKTLGLDPVLGTPEKLAEYQRSEIAKWAKVVKDSGAKAD